MEMNDCGEDNPYCYFHPKEVVVGVCAICLKERLLILASKQSQHSLNEDTQRSCRALRRRSSINLPKVFALGSFLHRLESRRHRPDDNSDQETIASLEDSFISIKFEDNGNALWDNRKPTIIKPSSNDSGGMAASGKESKGIRSIVEHTKKGAVVRWRKRISHLLQLARWKRTNKATACHVGLGVAKMEGGVKGRKGWIRTLTRRRTTTTNDH